MQPARLGAVAISVATSALLGILVLAPSSRAQTVLGTPQQTNDRIRSLSAASRVAPHDYVIGSGDVLSVDVFDVKELSRDVRVSQTGSIGLPLVPVRLRVAGLTELQVQEKISEVLESNGLVTHADVSVSVKDRKSKPITIVGAVPHPMVYQADRQVTVVEVLAEAGGIQNDAGDTILVTRHALPNPTTDASAPPATGVGDTAHVNSASSEPPPLTSNEPPPLDASSENAQTNTITINLNQLMETGDTSNNIVLQPGDIVTVPHAGIVYALGALARPGGFVMANDRSQLSTLKLLALAGGLNKTAKSSQAVIIRKDEQGKQHEVPVDLKKVLKRESEDVQLQPSDILYVPDSGARQALAKAAEIGLAVGTGVVLYRLAYR
ncbi:MAG TPA: polysaccharide biosynthesis/export family protein [Candidatus Saccharimonadales bacterium]|nr:polysaccharide biosynthesis/export family protein [Candidatus Saccharimonadales bacterium]